MAGLGGQTQTRESVKVKEPEQYRVLLHNDDYTPMEFVIEVIVEIFQKDVPTATKIMLDVHRKGRGVVGTYPYDIAITKADQVHKKARAREFPLRCSVEPT